MGKQSNSNNHSFKGVVVCPLTRSMYGAELVVENGVISKIIKRNDVKEPYILPGFVDSHIHIESSMLIPSRFAPLALAQGTVAVVADPHEVANVSGEEGMEFMLNDSRNTQLKFFYGVPSCVPASPIEKCSQPLNSGVVKRLLADENYVFLAEMMNFPGVIANDTEVIAKINEAKQNGKPIDGHAPALNGEHLKKYVKAGISTDHECTTIQEAEEKISLGMKLLIREGTAAKNFNALIPLLSKYPDSIMFCTDDCHPHHLTKNHINRMVERAVQIGHNIYDVLKAACINPVLHYNLPVGLLREGDSADFILVDDLNQFSVKSTIINGMEVYSRSKNILPIYSSPRKPIYTFTSISNYNLDVITKSNKINVINAIDGDLLTEWDTADINLPIGLSLQSDTERDILKIVLFDRYSNSQPVVAFIKGFGFQYGAIATSVAHDSHHLLSIGCSDESIVKAVDWVKQSRGGVCFCTNDTIEGIKLPFYGLMTDEPGVLVASQYSELTNLVRKAGSNLTDPFMTASFMALTVIPALKINHNGLFDTNSFRNIPLFI